MKNQFTLFAYFFCIGCCLLSLQSFAQTFNDFDYECLETPLVYYSPNQGNTHINCNDGIMTVDTLDDPCYDFYEEDGTILKSWYYVAPDENGQLNFYFDSLRLQDDTEFTGESLKYFELYRSGFWYSFYEPGNQVEKLSVRVKDISGEGVNFGFELSVGPEYYSSFEELANHEFEGINIDYTDEILTIEGLLERLYIGGDHLFIANLLLNETPTSQTTIPDASLTIYPNPFSKFILVEGTNLMGSEIQIVDVNGKVLHSEILNADQWRGDLDFLSSGVFWAIIKNKDQVIFSKAICKI